MQVSKIEIPREHYTYITEILDQKISESKIFMNFETRVLKNFIEFEKKAETKSASSDEYNEFEKNCKFGDLCVNKTCGFTHPKTWVYFKDGIVVDFDLFNDVIDIIESKKQNLSFTRLETAVVDTFFALKEKTNEKAALVNKFDRLCRDDKKCKNKQCSYNHSDGRKYIKVPSPRQNSINIKVTSK